jgi:acyl-CoA synthetase (NDP forming)
MAATFTAVMDGPQDATMLVLDAPPSPSNDPSSWYTAADALADAADATGNRGVVVATLAECMNESFRAHILERGLTPLLGLSEALTALDAAATVASGPTAGPHAPVAVPGATRLVDEASAKQRLDALGVPVPEGRVVAADHVLAAAAGIGYPITLKALGHTHKSETGAVKVGLPDPEALAAAMAAMPSTPAGFLVESTITDVVAEVLVSVRRDAPVGWLVTLGHGGVTTELWGDVTNLLAPITAEQVRTALTTLRSAPLLFGFRGRPAADIDALADLVVHLADGVVGTDVVEVELNPVLVGVSGATAVDALLIVED